MTLRMSKTGQLTLRLEGQNLKEIDGASFFIQIGGCLEYHAGVVVEVDTNNSIEEVFT